MMILIVIVVVVSVLTAFGSAAGVVGRELRAVVGRRGALVLVLVGIPMLGGVAKHPGPWLALVLALLVASVVAAAFGRRY